MGSTKLYYEHPAENWNEALPVGNGRLGAMIFGRVEKELIQMNEDSIWLGGYKNRNNPDALKNLPKVRKLLMDGNIKEGEKLLKRAFSGTPQSMQPYQTLGTLEISFDYKNGEINDYRRALDLENAVATTEFKVGDINYKREIFSSYPDKCMFMRISASEGSSISFDALLTRGREYQAVKKINDHTIYLYGKLGSDGMDFGVVVTANAVGGQVAVIGESLAVKEADEVILTIDGGSTFRYKELEKELCE